jgi:hypothetical protein
MSTDRNLQLRTNVNHYNSSGCYSRDVKITAHPVEEFAVEVLLEITGGGGEDLELGVVLNRSQAIALIEVLARIINGAEQ